MAQRGKALQPVFQVDDFGDGEVEFSIRFPERSAGCTQPALFALTSGLSRTPRNDV